MNFDARFSKLKGLTCGGQGSDATGRANTKTCELSVYGQTCQKAMPDLPCISSENPILVYDDSTPAAPKLYTCMYCYLPQSKITCYSFDPTAANPKNAWVTLGSSLYSHDPGLGVVVGGKIYLSSSSRGEIFDPVAKTFTQWPGFPGKIPYRPDGNACMVALTVNAVVYIYICGVGPNTNYCERYNVNTATWDPTIITLPNSCTECTCAVNPTNRNQIVISQTVLFSHIIF